MKPLIAAAHPLDGRPAIARGNHRVAQNDEPAFEYGLPQSTQAQIAALKRGWMAVGAAWQDGSEHCWDCSHCSESHESRPYGEGVAYENMSECTLGQLASDKPEQCPAYAAQLEDAAEAESLAAPEPRTFAQIEAEANADARAIVRAEPT